MRKLLLALCLALTFASCEKPRWYIYTYHWTDSYNAPWRQYNIIVDEVLSDGAIEVYRQTEDYKVIERGETSNGLVWRSYITYCCSQER